MLELSQPDDGWNADRQENHSHQRHGFSIAMVRVGNAPGLIHRLEHRDCRQQRRLRERGRLTWIFHQGVSPLVTKLLRAIRKRTDLGGPGAVQSVYRGKSTRSLARLCVPGLGLRVSDSYGYPLRSSPAFGPAYPSPSFRVLGGISRLMVEPLHPFRRIAGLSEAAMADSLQDFDHTEPSTPALVAPIALVVRSPRGRCQAQAVGGGAF